MNASIQQKGNQPFAGQGTRRLWLFGICALAIIAFGAFFLRSRDSSGTGQSTILPNAIAPAATSAVTHVSMRNLQFDPATIEVKSGDVVEWKNDDLVPHTATSASFNSGTIVSGESWSHTFTNIGNFSYVCTFHPQMKGVVIAK